MKEVGEVWDLFAPASMAADSIGGALNEGERDCH